MMRILQHANSYSTRERAFVGIALTAISATLAHFIRVAWQAMCGSDCFANRPDVSAPVAPEAYRVALPAAHRFVSTVLHLRDGSASDALIQFVCCLLALYILYRLAAPDTLTAPSQRTLAVAFFLAFAQYPLAFVLFAQRPETLPTALFVAIFLLCITKARQGWPWTALLLIATAAQAFARSDVPFVLGAALIVLSLRRDTLSEAGSRAGNLLRGIGVAGIAAGVQLYLQLVRFPHLPYETGSPVVFFQNFHAGHTTVLSLALLPFLCLAVPAWSRRHSLTAADKIACIALILYLPLWFTVGVVAEVRIGVPLLLALCPGAARVSAAYLLRADTESAV